MAKKLLNENSEASSLSAQMTRINYTQWILKNKLEREALEFIIESKRMNKETIEKAKSILESMI